jgi:hypothetical protein
MTIRSTGTNAPLHRREANALRRKKALIEQYVAEGMDYPAAVERAQAEMRDNAKGDWRRG